MTSAMLRSAGETCGAMVYCQQCRRYREIKPDGTCAECGYKVVYESRDSKADEEPERRV